MSEQPAFKAPAAPSAGIPQDLALIMELVGVPEPAPPACSSAGPFKQDTDREEEEPSEDDSPARVLKQLLPMGDDDEADKEDGEIESGSESDSSDSSSSSGSSSSTASSAAAGKGGGGRPSRKAHERNLSALDRLTREVSPANSDASEPDVDPSIFRSANEIPEPAKAPPLPFERIPEEDAVRELGVIRNVVGGSVIIEARLEVDARGQPLKEGGDAILGEGTIVCWDDGRVLGVVQDTFGPLTAPFYTFLLPDDFAQPTVQTPAAISAGETVEEKAAGPGVQEVTQTAEAVEQASEGQEKPPTPADVMITEDSNDSANITSDAGPTDAAAVDDALVEPATVEESKDVATPAALEKAEVVPPKGLVGLTVFYSYKSSKIVPTERLRKQKFTDASNKHDEEVGEDEMDWSDDEEEMLAKKRLKMMRQDRAASRAGSVRGGSPTPSLSSFSQHPDAPTSPTQSEAGSLYGGDFEADGETMIRLPGRAMPSAYEDWAEAASGPEDGTLGGGASGSAGGSSRGGGRGGRGDARGARGGRGNDRGNRGGKNDRGGRDGERGRGRGRGERGGARGGRGRGGADNAGNISNGSDGQHGLLFQGAAAYPTSLPALNGNGIYAPPFAAQQQQQADNSSLPPPPQAFSPLPRPQQQGGFMHYHPHQQPPPSVPFPGLSPQPTSNGQQFPRPPQPQQQQQQQGPPRYNHPGYPQQQQQHYGMQTQGGPPGHFNPSFGVQNGGYPAPVGFPVYPGQGGGYGGMGGFPGGGPPQGYNGGAMGNSRPPSQNQQLGQNAHGLNGFAPAPLSGSVGNPSNQDPAIQRALAEQQQKHERQLLEMQRQIALLSRRNAGSPGGAPAPGTGGTWQGPSDGGAF